MTIKITVNFDHLDQMISDEANKLALDLYRDLVLATPVDTGALRQAWQVDTSGPQKTVTNPLPYSHRLVESGWSNQAPSGTLSNIIDRYSD